MNRMLHPNRRITCSTYEPADESDASRASECISYYTLSKRMRAAGIEFSPACAQISARRSKPVFASVYELMLSVMWDDGRTLVIEWLTFRQAMRRRQRVRYPTWFHWIGQIRQNNSKQFRVRMILVGKFLSLCKMLPKSSLQNLHTLCTRYNTAQSIRHAVVIDSFGPAAHIRKRGRFYRFSIYSMCGSSCLVHAHVCFYFIFRRARAHRNSTIRRLFVGVM